MINPLARKAVVFPPTFNAPLCPQVSQPIANPETMLRPCLANSPAIYVPPLIPSGVASRVPITAIAGNPIMEISPLYHKSNGGSNLPSSSIVRLRISG